MRRYTFPVLVVLLCSLPVFAAVQLQPGRLDGVKTILMTPDLNGDGLDDIVGWDYVQFNLGGRFGPMLDIPGIDRSDPELGIRGTANFNNDPYADLVVSNGRTSCILLGSGSGSFKSRRLKEVDGWWVQDVVDYTGDGIGDLIVWKPDQLALFKGSADGTVSFLQNIPFIESYWQAMTPPTADFNGDGRRDFVLRSDTSFHFYIAKEDGTFEHRERFARFGPMLMATGDLNGDGHADVAFTCQAQDQSALAVLYGDGTGRFPGYDRLVVTDSPWSQRGPDIRSIAVGDFAEGGADEMAWGSHDGNVYLMSGTNDQLHQIATVKVEAEGLGVYPMRVRSETPEILATGYVRWNDNGVAFVVGADGAVEAPQQLAQSRAAVRMGAQASGGMYRIDLESSCPLTGFTELSFEREGLFLHVQKTNEIENVRAAYLPNEIYMEVAIKDGSTARKLVGILTPTPSGVLRGYLDELQRTPCGRLWASHKVTATPMR